jgi:hypothetical protein
MIRFTLSDGEICELSGIFEIFNGFKPPPWTSPEGGVALENNERERICERDVCFTLPPGASWDPTGDNTGNVTINGIEFVLQVYTSADGANDVLEVFEDTGWTPGESGAFKSPLGPFLVYDLESSNEVYGSLGVLENSGGENPQTSVVAATGQNPLSEADQETLNLFLNQVMDSVRPGL